MRRTSAVVCGAAILVALGGTGGAVAARLIGSEQIADNSVRSIDVRDGDLGAHDLGPGVRTTLDTALTGYEVLWTRDIVAGSMTDYNRRINCPDGKVALGGGQIVREARVLASFPATVDELTSTRATGWIWHIDPNVPEGTDPESWESDVYLYVTCAYG